MDSKRAFLMIFVFSVIFVFALSLAMAAKMPRGWKMDVQKASFGNESTNETIENQTSNGHHDENEFEQENETEHGHNKTKNMTYGRCVSNETKDRNVCYLAAKVNKFNCILAVKNQTDLNKTQAKELVGQCKEAYKAEKQQCKIDFKAAKNECKQYKKNYLERLIH